MDINVILDPSSVGEERYHFVFPKTPKESVPKALFEKITGGIYISKTESVPESITLIFPKNHEADK